MALRRWFAGTSFLEALGDQMARTLLPLLAVSVLGAGAAMVGVLNSFGLAAFLLLSMPIGAFADRASRPASMMTFSSLVRTGIAFAGVIAWGLGWLHGTGGEYLLLGVALTVGVMDVVYTTGRSMLIPRLVPEPQIRPMIGQVHTVSQIGTALAPLALAGVLMVLPTPMAWLPVAAAYLGSALTQRRYRQLDRGDAIPSSQPGVMQQLVQGIGHLRADATLRRITAASTMSNAAVMAANTLLPVLALTELRVSPATYASLGSWGAVCAMLGAAIASPLTERIGLRWIRICCAVLVGTSILAVLSGGGVLTLLPGPPVLWLSVHMGISGMSTSISAVAGSDLIARRTPRPMLGVVAGAQRTITLGVMPISALAFGAIGSLGSIDIACLIWAALALSAALPCIRLVEPSPT